MLTPLLANDRCLHNPHEKKAAQDAIALVSTAVSLLAGGLCSRFSLRSFDALKILGRGRFPVSLVSSLFGASLGGGLSGGFASFLAEQRHKESHGQGYSIDVEFIRQSILKGVQRGAVAGPILGGLIASRRVAEIARGVAGEIGSMSAAGLKHLGDSAYLKRMGAVGATSAALRLGYDLLAVSVFDREVTADEVASNALKAFLLGGLCGALQVQSGSGLPAALARFVPYHFVAFDIFGDLTGNYLVDIRSKVGDLAGFGISLPLLALEFYLAKSAFLPFKQGNARAAWASTLWVGLPGILLAVGLQWMSGRDPRDVDPGRFVGECGWGHLSVLLKMVVLENRGPVGNTAASMAARTAYLTLAYLFFISPSVSNFDSRMNHKNWWNVLEGNSARYTFMMTPPRVFEAWRGADSPVSLMVDIGWTYMILGLVNLYAPFYEGKPAIWEKGFKGRLAQTRDGKPTSFSRLTSYLCTEMGNRTIWAPFERRPSRLNLELVSALLSDPARAEERRLFERYRKYLEERRQERTRQEEMILQLT